MQQFSECTLKLCLKKQSNPFLKKFLPQTLNKMTPPSYEVCMALPPTPAMYKLIGIFLKSKIFYK